MAYFREYKGKWSFTIDIGTDPTGKRRQKSKYGFKSQKEAKLAAAKLMLEVESNSYIEPSKLLLKDFLLDWLNNVAKPGLRESTYGNHLLVIEKRIIPAIGHLKLCEIKPMQIQKFYNEQSNEGLSADYVRYMHSILKKAFTHAVKWEILSKSVVDVVNPPKLTERKFDAWSISEVNKFINHAGDSRFYIGYILALYTGMRRGEILGLRWKDVNLEDGKISVRQTIYRTKNGLIFQEPKTKNSKRQIGISKFVVKELEKHKKKQSKWKLQIGQAYEKHDLVCCLYDGKPIDPRNLLRDFAKVIKNAEVPKIRFHDLRHTHATLMLTQGVHPKIVSERLGHSRVGVTLDIYSHVIPDMQKDAADNFERVMQQKG